MSQCCAERNCDVVTGLLQARKTQIQKDLEQRTAKRRAKRLKRKVCLGLHDVIWHGAQRGVQFMMHLLMMIELLKQVSKRGGCRQRSERVGLVLLRGRGLRQCLRMRAAMWRT